MDRPSERSTKAQILAAYDALLDKHKAVEANANQLEKQLKEKRVAPSSAPSSDRPKPTLTGDQMMAVIETLAMLQSGFGGAINELSEKLTSKAAQLQELRRSVDQELHDLQALHELDEVDASTLATLIQTHAENAQAFEAELSQKQTAFEQEMQASRHAWKQEQEEHQRSITERDQEHKKGCQREAQEYQYNLERSRSLDQAAYEQAQKVLYKDLEETKLAQEKQWAEREKAIALQEQILTDLKAKVDAFEPQKAAAVKTAKAEAQKQAEYEAKVKADLRSKELEGAQRVYELKIESLQQTIQNQEEQLQNLSKQLNAALKQVQDLAVKAIEGSSNVQSYQAFKEIALEQAKTQMKGQ